MRLTAQERYLIRQAVQRRFGSNANVLLFGSRTDDLARGGDIDLLVECPEVVESDFLATIGLETDLQDALGDQKIDILIHHPGIKESPLHRIAKKTGIPL